MIKIILVDDEKHALITMAHSLQNIEEVEVLACIQDSRQAKAIIEELNPDLVFLDIEMPHISGIELLKSFENLDFKAVFVTAYNHYAIQALRLNAFDYLLKPIDQEEIELTIEKYKNREIYTNDEQIQQLAKFNLEQLTDTIALSTQEGLQFIKIEEIMYLIADNVYTFVCLNNGDKHLVSKSLSIFEEVLKEHTIFFRNHKSSIINLKYIKQYFRGDGGELVMRDGKNLMVSRTRKQDFLNLFKKI